MHEVITRPDTRFTHGRIQYRVPTNLFDKLFHKDQLLAYAQEHGLELRDEYYVQWIYGNGSYMPPTDLVICTFYWDNYQLSTCEKDSDMVEWFLREHYKQTTKGIFRKSSRTA